MKERSWLRNHWEDILKVVVILALIVGAIAFGVKVLGVDYTASWKRWLALVLGELSYLYSLTFFIAGFILTVSSLTADTETSYKGGFLGGLVLISLAAIIQLVFWGVVLSCTKLFVIIGMIALLVSIAMLYLILKQ